MRLRRHIRAVRLDHQPLERHGGARLADAGGVLEGQHAGERNVETHIHVLARGLGAAAEAVHHAALYAARLDELERFRAGVARVDYHGQVRFPDQLELAREGAALRFAVRLVIMVIEPDLAYRDRLRLRREAKQLGTVLLGKTDDLRRMHAYGGVDEGVLLAQLDRRPRLFHARGGVEDKLHALGGEPAQELVAVRVVARIVHMYVGIK